MKTRPNLAMTRSGQRVLVYCLLGMAAITVVHAEPSKQVVDGYHEITQKVSIEYSGFRKDLRTGELVQKVTVTNASDEEISANLQLAIEEGQPKLNLSDSGNNSADSVKQPRLVKVPQGKESARTRIKPGEQVSTFLRFSATEEPEQKYQTRVYAQPIK